VASGTTNGARPANGISEHRRFDTTGLWTRAEPANGDGAGAPPAAASQRAYLRASLPGVYHDRDGDFGLRFVGALETLLDPVVGLLDSLAAHLDPGLAPHDLLELMGAWLSVRLDEGWPEERWRALVGEAPQIGRRHGTRAGLELALRSAFPDLPLRVQDNGGVVRPGDGEARKQGGFVVYCDVPLSDEDAAALAAAIDQLRPVNVRYRLRISTAS
jgi:phage tail-like protein